MNIIVVGLSHRTAPVALRESFALSEEAMGRALYQIQQNPVMGEALILSTCNRVEVYAVATDTEKGCRALSDFFLSRETASEKEAVAAALYAFVGKDCLAHLFRVASSLDAMVIGEPQILGQVKEAFDFAREHKATGVILNKILRKAISTAKRIRTETKIAENAVSISFVAVCLAKKIFGKLDRKAVMLLGAGEMAELAVRHFRTSGVQTLFVVNRSYERAVKMAADYNGLPVSFDDCVTAMAQSDIVLCSAGAPHYLIGPEAVSKVIAARQNRPIFFIDISVPRNIDPAVNRLDNVFLYDLDDLKLTAEAGLKMREAEALKAEAIIAQETEQIARWYKSLDAVPLILALKEKAETIRQAESARALAHLSLTPSQRKAIDEMTFSLVNKLLHAPLSTLKEEASSANGSMVLESARRLFLLDAIPLARPDVPSPEGSGEAWPDEINEQTSGAPSNEIEGTEVPPAAGDNGLDKAAAGRP